MKHVTIAPSTSQRSPVDDSLNEIDALRNGLSIPIDSRLHPGDDGYRTPTIEDYEMHQMKEQGLGVLSNNSSHHRLPHTPSTPTAPQRPSLGAFRHSANASVASLSERLLEKLHWRERIRHYTWTFFTMTMATGGIANVLYEGSIHQVLFPLRVAECAKWQFHTGSQDSMPSA